jgi:hypothetical protein
LSDVLESRGIDELIKALQETPEKARPIFKKAVMASLELIKGVVKPYPPQPSRTRAETFNTYVRGTGHYPKSAFVEGQLDPKAKKTARKEGKVRLVSERLGSKWTQAVEFSDEAVEGIIGDTASYADHVQGPKKGEEPEGYRGETQTDFHAETGWVSLYGAVDDVQEEIYATFDDGVKELTEALSKNE